MTPQRLSLFEVNSSNPAPLSTFEGHTNNVTAVGFERDGRWMYSGSEDGTVKVWDLRASGHQREYESRGAVNSVVLHPNGVRGVHEQQTPFLPTSRPCRYGRMSTNTAPV